MAKKLFYWILFLPYFVVSQNGTFDIYVKSNTSIVGINIINSKIIELRDTVYVLNKTIITPKNDFFGTILQLQSKDKNLFISSHKKTLATTKYKSNKSAVTTKVITNHPPYKYKYYFSNYLVNISNINCYEKHLYSNKVELIFYKIVLHNIKSLNFTLKSKIKKFDIEIALLNRPPPIFFC